MFRNALSIFATSHGALCCGILGEEGQHPHFVRLPYLDLDRVLTSNHVPSIPASSGSEDEVLGPFLEDLHSTKWDRIWENPGWKAIVVGSELASRRVWVVFAAHHALMDGLSGCVFHRELSAAMSLVDCHTDIPTQLPVPLDLTMPSPIEELLKVPTTWRFWLNQIWHTYKPSYWPSLWPGKVSFAHDFVVAIIVVLITILISTGFDSFLDWATHHTRMFGQLQDLYQDSVSFNTRLKTHPQALQESGNYLDGTSSRHCNHLAGLQDTNGRTVPRPHSLFYEALDINRLDCSYGQPDIRQPTCIRETVATRRKTITSRPSSSFEGHLEDCKLLAIEIPRRNGISPCRQRTCTR